MGIFSQDANTECAPMKPEAIAGPDAPFNRSADLFKETWLLSDSAFYFHLDVFSKEPKLELMAPSNIHGTSAPWKQASAHGKHGSEMCQGAGFS